MNKRMLKYVTYIIIVVAFIIGRGSFGDNRTAADATTAETSLVSTVLESTSQESTAPQVTAANTTRTTENSNETSVQTTTIVTQKMAIKSVEELSNTQYFNSNALEHIFYGSINRQGNLTGFHYEGLEDAIATVIEGTRTKEDRNGVYEGKVQSGKKIKSGNNGYSSFYPLSWNAQEVVNAINEAYENKEFVTGNIWSGISQGIEINMYLDDQKKIISAFPIVDN